MRILLDTHALLWFLFDDPRLSERAAALIEDPACDKLFSMASLWEISIKSQIGKLDLGMPLERFFVEFVAGRTLDVLPIELPDLLVYHGLPLHHRDPFDRLLIAQATRHRVAIVTRERAFSAYDVDCIWS